MSPDALVWYTVSTEINRNTKNRSSPLGIHGRSHFLYLNPKRFSILKDEEGEAENPHFILVLTQCTCESRVDLPLLWLLYFFVGHTKAGSLCTLDCFDCLQIREKLDL
jgi:hypothetical protein